MTIYPLSFSRMQTFEQCALRFDYQYITATYMDAGSEASRFGNRVHEAFEQYCDEKFGPEPLPPELEHFESMLDRLKVKPGKHYYELQMAVREGKTPCRWEAHDCYMRGIADVAVVNGAHARAIDWKTGKPRDDTQQLKLMAAMLFAHFPELETVSTQYFWVYHPTAPSEPSVYTRNMLPEMWAHFDTKAVEMEDALATGVFKPKPSGLCPWCPAYETCGYARRRRR